MSFGQQPKMQETIRREMQQVLSEMSSNSLREEQHRGRETAGRTAMGGGALGIPVAGRPIDEVQVLRDRIAVLEDALSKSEADRSAIYAKHEAVVRALNAANAEKTALMHENHDRTGAVEASIVHRQEMDTLRAQMRAMGEQYETAIAQLTQALHEKDAVVRKLKKVVKATRDERKAQGVTLAELHYSNERLSAQLAKLQVPVRPACEDEKVAECESAVNSLTTDLAALETRLQQQANVHAMEKRQWAEQMEAIRREFGLERTECDRVMGVMSAKLEALVSENNFLRSQVSAATSAQQSPRVGRPCRRT